MDTLMKADIFFFVATVGVGLMMLVMVIGLIYIVRMLHDLRSFAKTLKEKSEHILDGVEDITGNIKSKSGTISNIFTMLASAQFLNHLMKKMNQYKDK